MVTEERREEVVGIKILQITREMIDVKSKMFAKRQKQQIKVRNLVNLLQKSERCPSNW